MRRLGDAGTSQDSQDGTNPDRRGRDSFNRNGAHEFGDPIAAEGERTPRSTFRFWAARTRYYLEVPPRQPGEPLGRSRPTQFLHRHGYDLSVPDKSTPRFAAQPLSHRIPGTPARRPMPAPARMRFVMGGVRGQSTPWRMVRT